MTETKPINTPALLIALQLFLNLQIFIFFVWLIQYITDLQQNNWFAGMTSALFYIFLNVLNFILLVSYAIQVRSRRTKHKSARWAGSVKILATINVILILAAFLCVDFFSSSY